MKKALPLVISLVAACILWTSLTSSGGTFQKEQIRMPEYEGKVNAPDFPEGLEWLNTDHPISLRDLKGQVVLLDFWTYCCINCMHVFPDLHALEEKYKDQPVVVIGVHSGKFDQEKDVDHIRQAILRHNINHPVAVDSQFKIWNSYGVQSWPTLILIDLEGNAVAGWSGEG